MMTGTGTETTLHIPADGDSIPYIMTPVRGIENLLGLLDAEKISYWVDECAISINDGPEVTVVNLRHGADAATVRNILDNMDGHTL